MGRTKALSRDSALNVVHLAATISEKIPLPEGVILRSDDEMVIWDQFTRTRTRDGWRDFDLLVVAKAVRLESDIRRYQQELDGIGAVITNDRGTPVVNPVLTVIDSLQRQQLALIRSISMNQQAQDPRTLNAGGKEQGRLRKAINEFDSLIPRG